MQHNTQPRNALSAPGPHYDGPVADASRRGELVLLTAALLASVLVGEAAVRLLSSTPAGGGYAPVRNDRRPVNSLGYRDLERTIPKPAGVRRAVCIGDSFTWGVGVLFDDAWPQRLERGLGWGRREPWQAINLAEPGLNAVQEASKLDSEGLRYGPDVVVLGYVLNDSEDETAAEARRAADWVDEQKRRPSRLESLLDRSALVRMVRARVHATIENRRRIAGFRSMYEDGYSGWIAAQGALRAMGGMCRERGVPLVVAIFPLFGNPLDARYPFTEAHAKVAQAAGEAGAKVVDLLPYYRGLDWRLLVVNGAADEHPNEIAHRIATQAILKAVEEVVPRDERVAPGP
jgi:hypothetical protein